MRILIFCSYFLPGYKAGGALRTLANMIAQLNGRFDFWVVTRDRDMTETAPYPGIRAGEWNRVHGATVLYLPPGGLDVACVRRTIAQAQPDLLYVNSFFSVFTRKVFLCRMLGGAGALPVVVAPEGEFSPGALRVKAYKKLPYVSLARTLGIFGDIVWKASCPEEEGHIRGTMGHGAQIVVAPDMPDAGGATGDPVPLAKTQGSARFVYLSRISPKKNLLFALESLRGVEGEVVMDIYGPVDDDGYWASCRAALERLPHRIRVAYRGAVPYEEVRKTLAQYHFFFFPTTGENFGHVVLESLSVGRPVLLSDQTPWRDLERAGVGWDLPLDDAGRWRETLQACLDMEQPRFDACAGKALRFAAALANDRSIVERNVRLLETAGRRRHRETRMPTCAG